MYPEVGDIGGAGQHQSAAVFIAEARGVFLHQKQVQPVAAFGRLTHQILMPAGEGIGVHHDAADDVARPALARQLGGVALQAARAVFHQHHDARHGGDRVETALAEQRLVLHLGVDKQLSVVALVGQVHQLGRQRQRQPFSAHQRADGDAFDNIVGDAAAGNQFVVLGNGNKYFNRGVDIQIVTAQEGAYFRNRFMIRSLYPIKYGIA